MPVLAPAVIGGVISGARAISAGSQLKKDKAELARLPKAFYKIQDEYFGNVNSAAEGAQSGFTQGAKDFYSDSTARGLGTGISGTLQAGGTPGDIARIFDSYNMSNRNFAAEDSIEQLKNIRYYHQTAKDLAAQKTIQWGVNEYQPYQNKLKELTQRIAADKLNIHNSINSAIGSVQAGVTSGLNAGLFKGADGVTEDPFSPRTAAELAPPTRPSMNLLPGGRVPMKGSNTEEFDPTQDILDRYYEIENILKRGGG